MSKRYKRRSLGLWIKVGVAVTLVLILTFTIGELGYNVAALLIEYKEVTVTSIEFCTVLLLFYATGYVRHKYKAKMRKLTDHFTGRPVPSESRPIKEIRAIKVLVGSILSLITHMVFTICVGNLYLAILPGMWPLGIAMLMNREKVAGLVMTGLNDLAGVFMPFDDSGFFSAEPVQATTDGGGA